MDLKTKSRITYEEVKVGEEGEDLRRAGVEGFASGCEGANGGNVELGHNCCKESRREKIQVLEIRLGGFFRHFLTLIFVM